MNHTSRYYKIEILFSLINFLIFLKNFAHTLFENKYIFELIASIPIRRVELIFDSRP